jgi:predicted N-formylglutamate amidohydrolase
MNETQHTLLTGEDPPPFTVDHENGASAFVFVADHAGRRTPQRLGLLGLPAAEFERHIAWDIGAGAVACLLGEALDAIVIRQTYSRLVIDCNRTPGSATSIVELSEMTEVPDNVGLGAAQRRARYEEIFKPYHARIGAELERRQQSARAATLVSVHSFTPVFKGVLRRWDLGMLYNRDARFAHSLINLLQGEAGLIVGDNEPYSVSDATDYTIPVHGERRGVPHVGIEIRQDLITEPAGQRRLASLLARLLPLAHARLTRS